MGETTTVKAKVHTIGGLSAHADQAELSAWYEGFANRPGVVLVHGEAGTLSGLEHRLRQDHNAAVRIARPGRVKDL